MSTAIFGFTTESLFENEFLNKETKSLKNTRKCVLFLSKTQPKHRKHSPIISPNVYAPTITADKHKLNLFGAIVSLIHVSSFMYFLKSYGNHTYAK